MLNLQQAIEHGKLIGVKYYIHNGYGHLVGGFTTLEEAEECKQRYEKEWPHTTYYISTDGPA